MNFSIRPLLGVLIITTLLMSPAQTLSGTTPEEIKEFQEAKTKAEKGDAEAQNKVGHCYRTGMGVARDSAEGVKWIRKAVAQGNALAQCNLGICYQYGDGVEQDYAEAFKFFQMAADQGATCGLANLAFCYKQGEGVSKNPVEAYAYYLAAGVERWATEVGKSMSPDQIAAAKRRSKEIVAKIAEKKAGK
jgi:TPR repeat protein